MIHVLATIQPAQPIAQLIRWPLCASFAESPQKTLALPATLGFVSKPSPCSDPGPTRVGSQLIPAQDPSQWPVEPFAQDLEDGLRRIRTTGDGSMSSLDGKMSLLHRNFLGWTNWTPGFAPSSRSHPQRRDFLDPGAQSAGITPLGLGTYFKELSKNLRRWFVIQPPDQCGGFHFSIQQPAHTLKICSLWVKEQQQTRCRTSMPTSFSGFASSGCASRRCPGSIGSGGKPSPRAPACWCPFCLPFIAHSSKRSRKRTKLFGVASDVQVDEIRTCLASVARFNQRTCALEV